MIDILLIMIFTVNNIIAYVNQTEYSFAHYFGSFLFYALIIGLLIYGSYMLITRNSDKSKKN